MARASQAVQVTAALDASDSAEVYDVIAEHFSSTRYKPWPLVSSFFDSLPEGSVGVDLGCGNGKYMHLRSVFGQNQGGNVHNASIATLGADRCEPLLQAARHNFPSIGCEGDDARRFVQEVAVADALSSGYRAHVFDFALSIATIHHFSTPARRRKSIEELIRLVRPVSDDFVGSEGGHGRFMVYVWAFEQRGGGRRLFDAQLAEHDDARRAQDVLVPWVRTAQHTAAQRQDVHHRCTYFGNN